YVFFFSSRRRHTRWPRDWSSDVCSSDLHMLTHDPRRPLEREQDQPPCRRPLSHRSEEPMNPACEDLDGIPVTWILGHDRFELLRSEERRVGKECSARRSGER